MTSKSFDPRDYALHVRDANGFSVGVARPLYDALKACGMEDGDVEDYVRAMWQATKFGQPAPPLRQFIKRPQGPS